MTRRARTFFRHASQRHTGPKHGKIIAKCKHKILFCKNDPLFQLEAESREFGDLVQGNFLDTYRWIGWDGMGLAMGT